MRWIDKHTFRPTGTFPRIHSIPQELFSISLPALSTFTLTSGPLEGYPPTSPLQNTLQQDRMATGSTFVHRYTEMTDPITDISIIVLESIALRVINPNHPLGSNQTFILIQCLNERLIPVQIPVIRSLDSIGVIRQYDLHISIRTIMFQDRTDLKPF